jgi:hypothetical protein
MIEDMIVLYRSGIQDYVEKFQESLFGAYMDALLPYGHDPAKGKVPKFHYMA